MTIANPEPSNEVTAEKTALARQVFRFWRPLGDYSLQSKLIIAFVAVSVVTVVAGTLFTILTMRRVLSDRANEALLAAAAQTADNMDAFINTNLAAIRGEAQFPVLAEYLSLPADQRSGSPQEAEARLTLDTLRRKDAVYIASYALLDGQGQDILDTYTLDIGVDKSDRDFFQTPMLTGLPYVSSVEFAPDTGKGSLYFSAPVRDMAGKLLGVVCMRYDVAVLQQIVVQATDLAGKGSFGILLDENHLRLAHGASQELVFKVVVLPDSSRAAQLQAEGRLPNRPLEEISTNLPDLEQALSGAANQPYFTGDVGEAALAEETHPTVEQAAFSLLKTRPWIMVFAQDRAVFLEPVVTQTRITLLMALAIAVAVAVMAFRVARSFSRPITRLTGVAEKITSGDLTARAPVESGDEVGVLAQAFNSMTDQLQDLIGTLEQRVADRARELERRSTYLQASADVGRAANSVLDLDELVLQTVDLIRDRFDLYYVGLFLMDAAREWAVLQAGTGETGRAMLARGHRLRIGGESMVGWSIVNAQVRIAQVAEEDAVRLAMVELPETRAEAALPLRSRGQVIGALTVQSDRPGVFDEATITVLQTMADQVAVAIDNARLFAEATEALEAQRRAYGQLGREAWRELLVTQNLRFVSDQRGTFPAGDLWESQMEKALRTGDITPAAPSVAIPIKVGDYVIGVVDARRRSESGEWSPEEIHLVKTLSEQLGVALESARLYQDTQRRAARERLISEVTARMRESLEIETLLRTAASEMRQALGLDDLVVRLTPLGPDGAQVEEGTGDAHVD